MPKPRAGVSGSSSKQTEFEVTPWQQFRHKQRTATQPGDVAKHDAGTERSSQQHTALTPAAQHLQQGRTQEEAFEARAQDVHRVLDTLMDSTNIPVETMQAADCMTAALKTAENMQGLSHVSQGCTDLAVKEDEKDAEQSSAEASGMGEPETGTEQQEEEEEPTLQEASQDVIKMMSFDEDFVPPAQPAARPAIQTKQQSIPAAVAVPPTVPRPNTAAAPTPTTSATLQEVQGTCRLAVLHGREGLSGHLVTTARTQLGVMAELVGSVSSSGHTCGMNDDEELFKVTIIRWSVGGSAGGEQVAYVVSSGGDMPRWRPAEPAHLLRMGTPGRREEGEHQEQQQAVTHEASAAASSGDHPLQVWFEATTLTGAGPQAEAMLARFAPKLMHRGADVVTGHMQLVGLSV